MPIAVEWKIFLDRLSDMKSVMTPLHKFEGWHNLYLDWSFHSGASSERVVAPCVVGDVSPQARLEAADQVAAHHSRLGVAMIAENIVAAPFLFSAKEAGSRAK